MKVTRKAKLVTKVDDKYFVDYEAITNDGMSIPKELMGTSHDTEEISWDEEVISKDELPKTVAADDITKLLYCLSNIAGDPNINKHHKETATAAAVKLKHFVSIINLG